MQSSAFHAPSQTQRNSVQTDTGGNGDDDKSLYTYRDRHTYMHDIHTYIHTSMHACMHACISNRLYTHMHTHTHTDAHTIFTYGSVHSLFESTCIHRLTFVCMARKVLHFSLTLAALKLKLRLRPHSDRSQTPSLTLKAAQQHCTKVSLKSRHAWLLQPDSFGNRDGP